MCMHLKKKNMHVMIGTSKNKKWSKKNIFLSFKPCEDEHFGCYSKLQELN
ncbi:hypothetical protein ACVWXS_002016 [Lysinibacillus sp. TE18511]